MFDFLKRLDKILPDVREDYIHIISADRNQVGDNKGGGGPDDQKDGQKAQPLRPREHRGQMWVLKNHSALERCTSVALYKSQQENFIDSHMVS